MYDYQFYRSPFGTLRIVAKGDSIVEIYLSEEPLAEGICRETPLIAEAWQQLSSYFEGKRTCFDLPLAPAGTPFQQAVWRVLCEIPYGERWSYRQVAERLGNPGAARAVGMANHRNPILFVIPCHRVIGADGRLSGYAAGVPVKAHLLDLESKS